MRGIVIRDLTESGCLAIDLRHVVDLLGIRGIQSQWLVSGVWATGEQEPSELKQISNAETSISGQELSRMANGVYQVIDGEFAGFENGSDQPWIVIRAVDSSFYEVLSSDQHVLGMIRDSFSDVSDSEAIL